MSVTTLQQRDLGGWEYPFPPVAAAWSAGDGLGFNEDAALGAVDVQPPRQVLDEATETPAPWTVTKVSSTKVTVAPATINPGNIMPTIGGTALDAGTPPELTISGSGTEKIYVTINASLTFNSDGYLTSGSISTATIAKAATVPSDNRATGTYYRHIATLVDGVITAQNMRYNLETALVNYGEFDDEADLRAAAGA